MYIQSHAYAKSAVSTNLLYKPSLCRSSASFPDSITLPLSNTYILSALLIVESL